MFIQEKNLMKIPFRFSVATFTIAAHFLISNTIHAQHMARGPMVNDGDIFGTRYFIENKGQFVNPLNKDEKILFQYDHLGEKIWFTENGLIFEHLNPIVRNDEDEKDEESEITLEKRYVQAVWRNGSSGKEITAQQRSGHYLTYGAKDLNSFGYKKIIYKEIYPFVDVEYSIPSDKEYGIKYQLIVSPGADLSKVSLDYSGDVLKISQLNGGVRIKTAFGEVTDHAPFAFYEDGTPVASEFNLSGKSVSFVFPKGIDGSKKLIVDPWITALTTFTPNNSGFDVDYDYAGNTFVYGGQNPVCSRLAMYNFSGALQWSFSGQLATPSWSNTQYAGNFVVEKNSGKSYLGQGFNINGSLIIRLDNLGNYDNFISNQVLQYREVWEMGFNCNGAEITVFGGTTNGNLSGASINTVTGVLNAVTFQPGSPGCCQDVVNSTTDNQSRTFILYASGGNAANVNNKLCLINTGFNGNDWTMPTTFSVMAESANKSAYFGPAASNGFNCLAVNNNFLYYYDGLNLAAYSKATGTLVSSVVMPSVTQAKKQGGIAVDDCDHLYLGGDGSILTYSFNGTTFTAMGNIPLGLTTQTVQFVYDLVLDRGSGLLYVSGSEFVGTYNAINSAACANIGAISLAASSQSICAGTSVTLTVSGTPTFTWTGLPTSASVVVVTPTSNTSYTVVSTRTTACGTVTDVAVKSITVDSAPTVTITGVQKICKGDKRALSVTSNGGNSYVWSTGSTTWTTTISPTVTTVYNVTVSNPTMICSAKGSHTVTVVECVGIEEISGAADMAYLYPSPITEQLHIDVVEPGLKNFDLAIYNSIGETVYSAHELAGRQQTIDLSGLPKGIYVVRIESKGRRQHQRLVKE
jgi:hypothetical protein